MALGYRLESMKISFKAILSADRVENQNKNVISHSQ